MASKTYNELPLKAKATGNLYNFYRTYVAQRFHHNYPANHLRELAKELTRLERGDFKKLAVSMPPRHGKSSMVTLAFPLWLLFQDPTLNILIVNNTSTLSEKFGIMLREYVRQYGYLFGVNLSETKHSNTHLMFCSNTGKDYTGSIRLTGSSGSITGQDVDYLIVDDPYKGLEEEFTPSAIDKMITWENSILEQRIEPHTRYCILHTRWHTNDLIGYYMKTQADDFHFVTYKAIQDDNTVLWPERYSLDLLLKKKNKIRDRLFSANYQQEPIDESSDFFNISKINWGTPPNLNINKSVRAWDIASSGKETKNDFTAGSKDHKVNEKIFYCNHLVHGRFGNENKSKIKSTASIDTPTVHILIETGVAAAGKLLFKEWQEQLLGYHVEQAQPITSKVDRATPFKNAMEDGLVYIDLPEGPARQSLVNELSSFPYGEHDDIIDSLSHGYNYLFRGDEEKSITPSFGYLDI
jgi:predicted phage terminase large subunit-like protein